MKKWAIFFIFFILNSIPSYCALYDFSDEEFEKSFLEHKKNIKNDTFLQHEITSFLKQEQTPVSLDECLDIAMENNFNKRRKFEIYKSAKYTHKNALAKFLPDFGYEFYMIYYGGQVLVGTALIDNFNELALSSMIVVEHALTKGGSQIFEAKEKKFEKYEAMENYNFSEDEVLLKTSRQYWRLVQAKINVDIYIKNLHERIIQLGQTELSEKEGHGTKFDVVRQKNEVADAKRNMVEAINEYRLRQATLSNTMGIKIETALYPVEESVLPLNLIDKDISLEELYLTAKEKRHDIMAMENKIKAIENERRIIYTEFAPKPRVMYQHRNQGTSKEGMENSNVIGLYVDWRLGENIAAGTYTKAKAKLHELNAKILELQNKLRDIKEGLLDSYYNSMLLLKRVDITKEQVNYATDSVFLAQERLNSGKGIWLDVIEAQNEKVDAEVEHLQAIIEYNINQIELLFDTGEISFEKIVKNYNP